ncbi:MAG: hypothetical protein CSB03_01090 [Bacteroidia bacterium]|nr:MAG: hypothetical protein CSB03_01090 [Bacteroidia bacterium]
MEVVVLELDNENRRLSLGHKQLEENPWDVFETLFDEGSIHEGTITSLVDKGALVKLPYGAEGFSTPKHLSKEDGSEAKKGDVLPFKVIEFNKNAKKIIVSHARTWEDEQRAANEAENNATQKNMKTINTAVEKTTLGDMPELADLKSKMEEGNSENK